MTITAYDAGSLALLGSVLGIWAHPDDETYSCGWAFRRGCGCRQQGCVCDCNAR